MYGCIRLAEGILGRVAPPSLPNQPYITGGKVVPMRTCKIEGCENKHDARGYCQKHYLRYKRHGDPLYLSPRNSNRKHGMCKTLEYRTWESLIQRCENKNNKSYFVYGGRGITVCDRWRKSFIAFKIWVGSLLLNHRLIG